MANKKQNAEIKTTQQMTEEQKQDFLRACIQSPFRDLGCFPIIHMESHQFEQIQRSVDYNSSWGKLKHPEDAEKRSAYFIEHSEDKQHAFCLN